MWNKNIEDQYDDTPTEEGFLDQGLGILETMKKSYQREKLEWTPGAQKEPDNRFKEDQAVIFQDNRDGVIDLEPYKHVEQELITEDPSSGREVDEPYTIENVTYDWEGFFEDHPEYIAEKGLKLPEGHKEDIKVESKALNEELEDSEHPIAEMAGTMGAHMTDARTLVTGILGALMPMGAPGAVAKIVGLVIDGGLTESLMQEGKLEYTDEMGFNYDESNVHLDVVMGALTGPLLYGLGAGGKKLLGMSASKLAERIRTHPDATPEQEMAADVIEKAAEGGSVAVGLDNIAKGKTPVPEDLIQKAQKVKEDTGVDATPEHIEKIQIVSEALKKREELTLRVEERLAARAERAQRPVDLEAQEVQPTTAEVDTLVPGPEGQRVEPEEFISATERAEAAVETNNGPRIPFKQGVENAAELLEEISAMTAGDLESAKIAQLILSRQPIIEKLKKVGVWESRGESSFYHKGHIYLNEDAPHKAIHEAIHSVTIEEMASNPQFAKEVEDILGELETHLVDTVGIDKRFLENIKSLETAREFYDFIKGSNDQLLNDNYYLLYATRNPGEFMAQVFSDSNTRKALRDIQLKEPIRVDENVTLSTLWDVFVNTVRKSLGLTSEQHTLLDKALMKGMEIAETGENRGLAKRAAAAEGPHGKLGGGMTDPEAMRILDDYEKAVRDVDLEDSHSIARLIDEPEKLKKLEELHERMSRQTQRLGELKKGPEVSKQSFDKMDLEYEEQLNRAYEKLDENVRKDIDPELEEINDSIGWIDVLEACVTGRI